MQFRWLLIFSLVFTTTVFAQTKTPAQLQNDFHQCYNTVDKNDDLGIRYCTTLINEANLLNSKALAAAYELRALAYRNKQDYKDAEADIQQSLKIEPHDPISLWLSGEINRGLGNYDKAIVDYQASLAVKPDRVSSYGGLSRAYYDKGEYDLGLQAASKALSLDPKYSYAYGVRFDIYLARKDYDGAIQNETAAIQHASGADQLDDGYYNRALAYRDKHDYKDAEADIQRDLSIKPHDAVTLWLSGEIDRGLGNYDKAIADYQASLAAKPDRISSYGGLATTYEAVRKYDLGIEAASKAISLDPKYEFGYWIRARLYQDKLDMADAIRDEDSAIQLSPKESVLYTSQADNYEYLGEWDKAYADLEKAIQIDPNNGYVYSSRAAAEWLQGAGDGDKAMADANKALLLFPKDYPALRQKAMIELARKHYAEAGDDMAEAVNGEPSYYYGVLWLHIIRSHAGIKDRDELMHNMAHLDLTVWPGPVLNFYAGGITKAQLLSQVETHDPAQNEIRKCESTFYIAEDELAKGHRIEAAAMFRHAMHICPVPYIEHAGARSELAMLHTLKPKRAAHAMHRKRVKH